MAGHGLPVVRGQPSGLRGALGVLDRRRLRRGLPRRGRSTCCSPSRRGRLATRARAADGDRDLLRDHGPAAAERPVRDPRGLRLRRLPGEHAADRPRAHRGRRCRWWSSRSWRSTSSASPPAILLRRWRDEQARAAGAGRGPGPDRDAEHQPARPDRRLRGHGDRGGHAHRPGRVRPGALHRPGRPRARAARSRRRPQRPARPAGRDARPGRAARRARERARRPRPDARLSAAGLRPLRGRPRRRRGAARAGLRPGGELRPARRRVGGRHRPRPVAHQGPGAGGDRRRAPPPWRSPTSAWRPSCGRRSRSCASRACA